MDDREAVQAFNVAKGDRGWKAPVDEILERMALIRSENPDGDWPTPFHDPDDACTECDALRVLELLDEQADESAAEGDGA